jgi:hypothetical protein
VANRASGNIVLRFGNLTECRSAARGRITDSNEPPGLKTEGKRPLGRPGHVILQRLKDKQYTITYHTTCYIRGIQNTQDDISF